ncbi:hypothetical protein B0H10DRAFT_1965423 [Mycena sp. CBHHK59/15]|nr:hypothetical protein B0H10DRAFT_1965423 [Mycena sp. CBHHK59/15]
MEEEEVLMQALAVADEDEIPDDGAVEIGSEDEYMAYSSGSVLSLDVQLAVSASLPFDLVLGRDWLVHCTNSVPDACFYLSSGLVNLASFAPDPPASCSSTHSPTMDIDGPEYLFLF